MPNLPDDHDVIIVGGGPAGLSAGLLLGRSRRRVILCDDRRPRNAASTGIHVFLGNEGSSPLELLEKGRDEISRYSNVDQMTCRVSEAELVCGKFRVSIDSGAEFRSRALLIAGGLVDRLPAVGGVQHRFGHSVHVCPYCSGWECADRILGVMGEGNLAGKLALELLLWSDRLIFFGDVARLEAKYRTRFEQFGVSSYSDAVVRLAGPNRELQHVVLRGGNEVPCDALFVVAGQSPRAEFARRMGCRWEGNAPACGANGSTDVPGLYFAGNATPGPQLAMIAAAEGVMAGTAINEWLLERDGIMPEGC
jgi:thioredoxin reductase